MKKIVFIFHTIICCTIIANAQGNNKTNGTVAIERQDADALLVSNSTIDESYLLGDGAEVTFDGDFIKLAVDGETHQYELSESDALNINFSHTFKLTAIQDPNNTANYFATFYTGEGAYKLPEGTKAYIGIVGKSGENNVVVQNEIDTIIHKGEAVMLQTKSENITLMPSSNKNAAAEGNVLTGTDETKNLVTGDYVLFSDLNNIGFHKWDDKTIDANNAYLNFGENKGDIFYLARIVSYVTTDENIKVSNDTVIIDSKITNEPTVSKTGYRLDGWYKESTLENKWDFATEVVTENISLYAQWIQQFTVAFVTNGAAETIESQAIDINQKVTEPSVSKTGCEFRGWYTESTFENQWDFANDVVTANITLYAEWHQHVGVAQSLAATCEGNGYAEHFVCECGKAFTTVDCTTEITDLAAWKVGDGLIPALNHDFALGEWSWNDENSVASVSFICKNDDAHVENVDAIITTDTVQATCTEDGKISYFAVAIFQSEEYKDTIETILPAINHDFALDKWLWNEDKSIAKAVFVCKNDSKHADMVVATITTDTIQSTADTDGKIVYTATTEFEDKPYTDTKEDIIPAIGHEFVFGKWLWSDDKKACAAVFNCINEENHADTVVAEVTADTLKATCTADGLITSYAVATFNGEDYKDTVTTVLPALNHDYALGEWSWKDDNSAASVSFICNNDETHVEIVDAVITTDTVMATCTEEGKISYFAVATFQSEKYKDTVVTTIPALSHDFALDKWLWSDDKSQCSAIFVCANDKQHADTISAVVTSDTTVATLTENGKIVYIASVTYEENNYADTTEVILYPLVSYENIIDMIEGTYTLTSYTGNETNKPAKDLYFKFYGTDTITQGQFNSIEYNNLNVSDLTNIVVSDTKISFDNKSNTTFSFSVDAELNTCTELTIKNSELEQVCVLTKTPVEEINIADIWNIIEGSYINENGKVQNFIMEFDSEMGKDTPCFMWVDQFNGAEGFENVDGYFPLAGDEYISIEKTGNYYDFKISDEKYFTLTIENYVVTGFMTYGYDDEDVFKGNYKKLAYSDILEEIQGTYYLTTINGESKTENVQVDFEDENFIIIRNGKVEQKTLVENISRIMYMSDSIAIIFKDNSMFAFNIDSDTIAKFILTSGGNVLEFSPNNPDPKEPEAVSELTDNITVFVRNSNIVVSGLTHDDVVTINTIDGKLLYKQLQKVETAIYDIYGKGIYFVKVGNRTFTVLY